MCGENRSVQVCPIVRGFDKPRQYMVEVMNMGRRVALDAEGRLHEAVSGYKVVDPPTFATFKEAVNVAREFVNTNGPTEYARRNGEWVTI